MNRMKQEWQQEKHKLTEELHKTQKRLERLEKEKIRNNLVITGIQVDTK